MYMFFMLENLKKLFNLNDAQLSWLNFNYKVFNLSIVIQLSVYISSKVLKPLNFIGLIRTGKQLWAEACSSNPSAALNTL